MRIRRLQRDLDDAPAAVRDRQAAIKKIDDQVAKLDEHSRRLRAQIKLRENELKGHEQKIERLKQQSSEVRTNKEFVAFRSEIANAQGDCDRLQNEILKIMEVVEQADTKIKELDGEKATELENVATVQERIDSELADVRRQVEELTATRPQAMEGIPKEELETYERVRRARGDGMAALEGQYCSSCGELQTRNDVYAVQNRARLVPCKSCNRILYQL